jgi:predicted ATPase
MIEGYFQLKELGKTSIKGVSEPVELFEVIGIGPLRTRLQAAARRGLTRFIGRDGEMAQMRHALELTREGRGQVVAAMGEAGVGKSRLFFEFKAVAEGGCLVLEGYSVSHGKASAYLPVTELLREYFGITSDDDDRTRRERILGKVLGLDRSLEDTLPYLYSLFGIPEAGDSLAQMDPQIRRRRTQEVIKRILLRESLNQPLIVIFEDLQWIDGETQALLNLLVDAIASARILLVVNYRPDYHHDWGSRTHYTQLRLDPLGRESAAEMLSALLGDEPELEPLRRLIADKTEGNPFFLEEIVQALFEQRVLTRNGSVKVTHPLSAIKIPPTVQAVLASRIDRLPPIEKELLQTLAVIGREFTLPLILRMTGASEAEVERLLSDLQSAEFIYEHPAFPDPEYSFKHALTQEVAYNSVLIERRKLLHERVAEAIESLYANGLEDRFAELAHHYGRSSNLLKAVEYLGRAGQQALQRSAYSDAIAKLHAAIDLLQKLPRSTDLLGRELQLQLELVQALIGFQGWAAPDTELTYGRVCDLAERLSESYEFASGLWGLWVVNLLRAQLPQARDLAEKLVRLAEGVQEPALSVPAYLALGPTLTWLGEVSEAGRYFEKAMSIYDPRHHGSVARLYGGVDPRIFSFGYWLWTLWHLGYPDKALQLSKEAFALAHALSEPHSQAFALTFAAYLHQCRREVDETEQRVQSLISISEKHGLPNYLAWATILRGWTVSQRGCHSEGISEMHDGLIALQATGEQTSSAYHLTVLVEQCHKSGRMAQGSQFLTTAFNLVEAKNIRLYEAEVHRLRAELLVAVDEDQAERCFRRAVDVARSQGTKSLQLRASLSLARLLGKQGRRDEARTTLAEIYNWFTEGFDTRDLQEAKQLLNELDQEF